MSEKIIPQDGGTGLDTSTYDPDWAAAAAVAALAAQGQNQIAVAGFGFTVDSTNDDVTVSEGQALLEETNLSDGRTTGMDWLVGGFPCRHPGATVGLYPDVDTDIYLDADIKDTAPDTLSLVSVDSEFGTPPSEPRLLIGTVHSDYSTTLKNRVPAFDELIAGSIDATDATVSNAPTSGTGVARKTETDDLDARKYELSGDTLAGPLDADGNDLQNVGRSDGVEALGIANAARHHVASDESAAIPEDYSEVIEGPVTIAGDLTIAGRLTIL